MGNASVPPSPPSNSLLPMHRPMRIFRGTHEHHQISIKGIEKQGTLDGNAVKEPFFVCGQRLQKSLCT